MPARMTEEEYRAFQEKTGYKNLDEERQKQEIIRRKKMADMEKIQYYATDLAYALDIGEIADMFVVTENGTQILKMTVIPKKHDEYKTVRAAPVKDTRRTVKRKQLPVLSGPGPVRMNKQSEDPDTLGGKLLDMGKKFMAKKDKPQFMKDAGF